MIETKIGGKDSAVFKKLNNSLSKFIANLKAKAIILQSEKQNNKYTNDNTISALFKK